MSRRSLIETDDFDFEFLSTLAELESWRKEVHRPIYHVHKWWAKRLGSVFRGILLGCRLPEGTTLAQRFYENHDIAGISVFDPFMGSGTTIGEAHKLGLTALGRDINPVAVQAVRVALGPMDEEAITAAFDALSAKTGDEIRRLYRSKDKAGRDCDVLYWFWVMQGMCPDCGHATDLFDSRIFSRNAYPSKHPEVQVCCPACGDVFESDNRLKSCKCPSCSVSFDHHNGVIERQSAICSACSMRFKIVESMKGKRPSFRLYAKMVLTQDGGKEYLPATKSDVEGYQDASSRLTREVLNGRIRLPSLTLEEGYNTTQAIRYGFTEWKDFFNDRQLLALGLLRNGIASIEDENCRSVLMTLFSGVLEFNNMFASFKGEGTGAVRHMFAHHILKPERTPIEANCWGTPKSSGAFSTLFQSRIRRALEYRKEPSEVTEKGKPKKVASAPFTGRLEVDWPTDGSLSRRGIYLSCGDSSATGLPDESIDLVVTDPPFFDNVHYSELADFFYAWQQIGSERRGSTRHEGEVQDINATRFEEKLRAVLTECHRILKPDGILAFTYHHSKNEGWSSVAAAIVAAGLRVVTSQPVKAEMAVATPKSQSSDPINLDIIIVCRKAAQVSSVLSDTEAIAMAEAKTGRMQRAGFSLSNNDRRVIAFGQLLATIQTLEQAQSIACTLERVFSSTQAAK